MLSWVFFLVPVAKYCVSKSVFFWLVEHLAWELNISNVGNISRVDILEVHGERLTPASILDANCQGKTLELRHPAASMGGGGDSGSHGRWLGDVVGLGPLFQQYNNQIDLRWEPKWIGSFQMVLSVGWCFVQKWMAWYGRCFRNPKDVQKTQEEFGCLGLGTTWKYCWWSRNSKTTAWDGGKIL